MKRIYKEERKTFTIFPFKCNKTFKMIQGPNKGITTTTKY